ncbi:MAG: CotH kinase family protein [Planctomycetales bacterium]|nr:CotH kinase family protein [Planctomycetales bacterium]
MSAQPIISEFMAANDSVLLDGNGAASDWIELLNNGDQAVDLAGYALTDDPDELEKWSFPSTTLAPGEFLVVFASGNGVADAGGNLHTNFALAAGGEYLALVSPSGTILSQFGSSVQDYPPQTEDVSYGLAFDSIPSDAIGPDSDMHFLVPANAAVDATWTSPSFNDSSWTPGLASLGYETSPADYASLIQTTVPAGTTSVYLRIPFDVSSAAVTLDSLQLKYDDGFVAYLNGTQIARENAPGILGFDSLATNDHPDAQAVQYETYDVREYSNLLHPGENVLAIHVLNVGAASSDLLVVPKLTLGASALIEPVVEGFMVLPTPGAPNTNLRANSVQMSHAGGTFAAPFQLVLATDDAAEVIRYTTDGSIPGPSSLPYTGPLTISTSIRIRARAFGPIGQVGNVTSAAFTRTNSTTNSFTSDLPVVVLENYGQGTPGSDFEDAWFSLYDVDEVSGRSSLSAGADFTSLIGQHVRGSSTAGQPKTNLRIELRDDNGDDQGAALLGMPSESDWILYAPYNFDRAMIRNSVLYDFSRQMGDYAARTRFVEVYANFNDDVLNGDDYMGVYVLMENIKIDDNRVDISELNPTQNGEPDVTGGYILKIDRPDDVRGSSWTTSRGIPSEGLAAIVHVEPEIADLTIAQRDYIRGYVQDFEDALFGPDSADPLLGYEAYLDVLPTIDHHLMQVFSKNPDGLRLSTYLVKDRNGKLAFGPIWDFDRAAGADDDSRAADPVGWNTVEFDWFGTDWWGPLFDDPDFTQRWVDRWQELRSGVLSDANIQATIDVQANQLTEAQARNFAKWPSVAPNGGPYAQPGLSGWQAEISQLAGWFLARAQWMDAQMLAAPGLSPAAGNVSAGTLVTLSSNQPGAQIYYTLDGSDPRGEGGALAPSAMLYTGSFAIAQSTQIVARAVDFASASSYVQSNPWSGKATALYSVETPADASNLRITELHYHPADPTSAELSLVPGVSDSDFEFVELSNISASAVSLNGVKFTEGIAFDFTGSAITSLQPGKTVLVVSNLAAFEARYGTNLPVAGAYSGQLSNGGEEIELVNAADQAIFELSYDDQAPWPATPDGGGPSLEVIDVHGNVNSAANWQASQAIGGTPGALPRLPGDFNDDSSVDGADFLAWQRGFGGLYGSSDLVDWQENFGTSSAPTTQSVVALAIAGESHDYVALAASTLANPPAESSNDAPSRNTQAAEVFRGRSFEPSEGRQHARRLSHPSHREAIPPRQASRDLRHSAIDLVLGEWQAEEVLTNALISKSLR